MKKAYFLVQMISGKCYVCSIQASTYTGRNFESVAYNQIENAVTSQNFLCADLGLALMLGAEKDARLLTRNIESFRIASEKDLAVLGIQ